MIWSLPTVILATQAEEQLRQRHTLEFLSGEERAAYHKLPINKQCPWLLGRLAAKTAAQAYFAAQSITYTLPDIKINNAESGAPFILLPTGMTPPAVSISHTNAIGVAAVAAPGTCLGVDIEKIRHWNPRTTTAFTTKTEQAKLTSQATANQNAYTTFLWSAKEAYLKLLQTGIKRHPQTIEVTPQADTFTVADDGVQQTMKTFWTQYADTYIITLITT